MFNQNNIVPDGATFDFIIAGGGTAGAIVAQRLTAGGRWTALLVEAGGDPPIDSVVPGLIGGLVRSQYDWNYYTYDAHCGHAQRIPNLFPITKGKMLGGSSGVNSMIYVRGSPTDYDNWAALGLPGWDWRSVFPYFLKSEDLQDEEILTNPEYGPYHSTHGPIIVTKPRPVDPDFDEKLDIILRSMGEIGIKPVLDVNGPTPFGIARTLYTQSKPPSVRYSTAQAYLVGNKQKNLYVLKHAYATKVLIDSDKRAYGLEVVVNGTKLNFFAKKEVIASTGVINTPKLLIASGIGPKADLQRLGVPQIVDLPVGTESQDHFQLPFFITGAHHDNSNETGPCPKYTLNQITLGLQGFYSTCNPLQPDFQIVAYYYNQSSPRLKGTLSETFFYNDEVTQSVLDVNAKHEIFLLNFALLRPKSRGGVRVTGLKVEDDPEYFTNYFQNPADLDMTIQGIRRVLDHLGILDTHYFSSVHSRVVRVKLPQCDKYEFLSDEYLRCYCLTMVAAQHHQASTCPMGSVVDHELKVYHVERLRVVDASVMPIITSGNIMAPVYMIAEKAADLIALEHGHPI
ncbi:hypothetical protein JYU34_018946 [Plutella xylostella]|uniref:Glucose-methanol-choline oxidoreductase N-terminal domain-containing protein n=1 Tax=Plutella xylostella TaxID=51655 RepID=A0ABQ7PYV2_PLUXY|nr:hypothetical protein JYU34_018946 [Plutella xylostella]